jgi:hypothetical protein
MPYINSSDKCERFVLTFPFSQYVEHSCVALYFFPFMRITLRCIYIIPVFIDRKDKTYISNCCHVTQ